MRAVQVIMESVTKLVRMIFTNPDEKGPEMGWLPIGLLITDFLTKTTLFIGTRGACIFCTRTLYTIYLIMYLKLGGGAARLCTPITSAWLLRVIDRCFLNIWIGFHLIFHYALIAVCKFIKNSCLLNFAHNKIY